MITDIKSKSVGNINNEEFYNARLPDALKSARDSCKGNSVVAPMYLLAKIFDSHNPLWYTANTEDVIGIDNYGEYVRRGEPVVITIYGGLDGNGMLTPELLNYSIEGHTRGEPLIIEECSINLDLLYSHKNTVRNLLQGKMPDRSEIPIFSYNDLVTGDTPKDFRRFAVVRSLDLAQKTKSGFQSIENLVDFFGNVSDSQLITFCGGLEEANYFISKIKRHFKGFELWNPFSSRLFDPGTGQARIPVLGSYSRGFDGNNSLVLDGRYLVYDL